jgi:hypothetical protein
MVGKLELGRSTRGLVAAVALLIVLVGAVFTACGEATPDFSGATLDGREVSLGDYRGRPLILAFMADW